MTRKQKFKLKHTFLIIMIGITLTTSIMMTTVYQNIIMQEPESAEEVVRILLDTQTWQISPGVWATNQSPGAGTPGVVQIVTLNDAFSTWDNPIDEDDANIYEESDGTFTDASVDPPHEELDGTTPFDTDFHIATVYQFNKSQAYDGGAWNSSRVKAYINTTGLKNDAVSVEMSKGAWYTGDDVNTQRITFYLLDDDGGADDANPLQINIDAAWNANVTYWYYG